MRVLKNMKWKLVPVSRLLNRRRTGSPFSPVPFCSGPVRSRLHAVFSHIHALSLVSPLVEYSELALHISLNPQQKLTSNLCALVMLHRLSNSPLSTFLKSIAISFVL